MTKQFWIAATFAGAAIAFSALTPVVPVLRNRIITGHKAEGDLILLTTSQLLRPWGRQTPIPGRPVDLAIDSSRRHLAVLNMDRIDIVDTATGAVISTKQIGSTSYTGIAFRPGDREIWVSETQLNIGEVHQGGDAVAILQIDEAGKLGEMGHVSFATHAVPAGISFTSDGSQAWVALNRENEVAVIDAHERKVIRHIPVGMAPFGVAVASKAQRVFVTNRAGRRPKPGETTAPSSGSPVLTDATTGSTASGTVSVISMQDFSVRDIPVGLAPSVEALSPDGTKVAVANAHSDSLSVIDTATEAVQEIRIPTWPESTIGSQPVGAAFSPDGQRIYVPCAGNNAVAVLSPQGKLYSVAGAVPTGWFPSAVAVDHEGGLHVANLKGMGDTRQPDDSHRSTHWEGLLQSFPPPSAAQLMAGAREVRALNEPKFEPRKGIENLSALGIEHVVFIIKENRTYDQVFGDIEKGNGDRKFLQYGREITPNAHALAERYVLLDNFYTSGAISFDGHQWLMMAFVSDYTERSFAAYPRGYAWEMGDALTVAPTGFFWQGAPKPLGVRVYGEFCVGPDVDFRKANMVDMTEESGPRSWAENLRLEREGRFPRVLSCQSGVPALQPIADPYYSHSMVVPDQAKAQEFFRELDGFEKAGRMPNLIVMTLNNDHTNGTRPGSPTPRAMVAENDLALGRVVERLSKSKFWQKTLILVTEDDAQAGLDHIDGHRTIGLVIGPHVKRGAVDSSNYTHLSMLRTIQDIFGVPSRTRFVKAARAMNSVFTPQADNAPFQHLTPEVRLDEMNPPLSGLKGRQRWAAKQSLAMDFDDVDRNSSETLNRILWWNSRGYDVPYPTRRR